MKVIKGMQVLYDFTGQNFNFETIKLQELYAGLKPEDKKLFFFDHTSLNWSKYFETSTRLGRRLILKDDESTIPKAHEKLKKFYYADWIVKVLFGVLGLWLLKNIFF